MSSKTYNTESKLWGIVLAAGEGERVKPFLSQLCGGSGIKQFCAVIGRRSMLQHTLARVERAISRERILVVVGAHHWREAAPQLAGWPTENVIYQPENRETAPGILLPLAHISHRDPSATVAVFPSDHFVLDETKFMASVCRAVDETQHFPDKMILLGMTPDRAEKGYGWVEPESDEAGHESLAVRRFWEKPSLAQARELVARRAFWNSMVFTARAETLWTMVQQVQPDLYHTFTHVRMMLNSRHSAMFTKHVYQSAPTVNFSSEICGLLPSRLRLLPVPEVGWSDWGKLERICASLQRIGKWEECLTRLQRRKADRATGISLKRSAPKPSSGVTLSIARRKTSFRTVRPGGLGLPPDLPKS